MSGEADDLCTCGHRRERHAGGYGVCFEPEGMTCWCSKQCRSFTLDAAAMAALKASQEESRLQHGRIARAKQFVDADWNGEGWKPSELMSIGYCILATSQHPETAAPWLDELLEDARELFRAGKSANPFCRSQEPRP